MTIRQFAALQKALRRGRPTRAPAPADTRVPAPPPVPGHTSGRPLSPPPRPAPAPGRHGGIDYAIAKDKCGRIRIWPGDGTVLHARRCGCPRVDLSDERIARFIAETSCPGCGRPSGIWCKPGCEYAKDTET